MNCFNDTPISRKNKHLNAYERGQIALLHSQGKTPYMIAKLLNRASNTIRNELKRGTVPQIKGSKTVMMYFPETGQASYDHNRKNCGAKYKLLKCECFIQHVTEAFFEKKHSLDAICGRLKKTNKFKRSHTVCMKTLYNYVDLGLIGISNIDLPFKLRRSTKPARTRKHKKVLGASIAERPQSINDRSEFGHWEVDTIVGKKGKSETALLTLTERVTRKEIIRKIPNRTSESVQSAINELVNESGPYFSKVFKSFTADNGSEFSELSEIESLTGSNVYFAHPYASGERGTNERHNGLIRRFVPKGKSINDVSLDMISKVQVWCNTLPRKILGYQTPDEAFEDSIRNILYC